MAHAINILVTGYPGVGKTTLIVKVAQRLKRHQPAGFYTQEIRHRDHRVGFELVTLEGRRQILSHVDIDSRERVGKYGVDVAALDRFLLTTEWSLRPLIIIDEIGKMECLSAQFIEFMKQLLDSASVVIATIARGGAEFIVDTRRRPDCLLFDVTRTNRNELAATISDEEEGLMEELP